MRGGVLMAGPSPELLAAIETALDTARFGHKCAVEGNQAKALRALECASTLADRLIPELRAERNAAENPQLFQWTPCGRVPLREPAPDPDPANTNHPTNPFRA